MLSFLMRHSVLRPISMTNVRPRANFKLPALYAIANIDDCENSLSYIESLIRAGAGIIQLRAKTSSDEELTELCIKTRNTINDLGLSTKLIINDHVAIAKSAEADGVHLGQDDESAHQAREVLGPDAIIGLSTHSIPDVQLARYQAIDYLGFGPVFQSPTKSGHAPVTGLEGLTKAVSESPLPIVAIGGITLEKAEDVFRAGAQSAAVVSDLANATDLSSYLLEFEKRRSQVLNSNYAGD